MTIDNCSFNKCTEGILATGGGRTVIEGSIEMLDCDTAIISEEASILLRNRNSVGRAACALCEKIQQNIPNEKFEKIYDKRLRECNYGSLDGEHKSLVIYEDHIIEKFPKGESLKDVEIRIRDFIEFLKKNY